MDNPSSAWWLSVVDGVLHFSGADLPGVYIPVQSVEKSPDDNHVNIITEDETVSTFFYI